MLSSVEDKRNLPYIEFEAIPVKFLFFINTVWSHNNTPCYNMGLYILRSCCGSQFFYHVILPSHFPTHAIAL